MGRMGLIGLALLLASGAGPAGGQEIYLRRAVVVEGPRLLLGELAEVAAADPVERQRLAGMDLGPAPGLPTLLPLRSIRGILDAGLAGKGSLIGSRLILLPAASVPEEARGFYRELLGFLDEREADPRVRLEVEIIPADGRLPPVGAGGVQFLADPPAGLIAGGEPVAAWPAEGEVRIRWRRAGAGQAGDLRLRLRRFLPVALAAEELKPGAEVTPERVRLVEAEVAPAAGSPPAGAAELLREIPPPGRYRALARIPAGSPLPLRSLQKALPVKGGDQVRIAFVRPGIRLSMPGRAFGSGDLRDCVEVAPLLIGRRFRGTVTGAKEVEVVLP